MFQIPSLGFQDPSFSIQHALLTEKMPDKVQVHDIKYDPVEAIGGGTLMMGRMTFFGNQTQLIKLRKINILTNFI